jgi:hypothetical protein
MKIKFINSNTINVARERNEEKASERKKKRTEKRKKEIRNKDKQTKKRRYFSNKRPFIDSPCCSSTESICGAIKLFCRFNGAGGCFTSAAFSLSTYAGISLAALTNCNFERFSPIRTTRLITNDKVTVEAINRISEAA